MWYAAPGQEVGHRRPRHANPETGCRAGASTGSNAQQMGTILVMNDSHAAPDNDPAESAGGEQSLAVPVTPLEHELADCNQSGKASAEFVAELLAADFLVPELMGDDGSLQHLVVSTDNELYLSVFTSLALSGGADVNEEMGDRLVSAPFYEISKLATDMGTGLVINPDLNDEGFGETLSGWLPAPFVQQMALRASSFEFIDDTPVAPDGLFDLIVGICQDQFPDVIAAYAASYVASGREAALMLAFELDDDSNPNQLVPDLWSAIEVGGQHLAADLTEIEIMVLDGTDGWEERRFYQRA